jgi:hypothetical protein
MDTLLSPLSTVLHKNSYFRDRALICRYFTDRRLVVTEGKGGHHRVVPAADRFFEALGGYLHDERPAGAATDRVFVVLKGPRRGLPLSAEGLDEILAGARRGPGWSTRPAMSCGTRA